MIGTLLTGPVEAAELRGRDAADPLLPAEHAALGDVLERRRRDFARGRHCAHRALARLGVPDEPVLTGPDREPRWPRDVVGSITHCESYAAAAVALRADVAALGIDAEPHAPLPDGVLRHVAGDEERAWLHSVDGSTCWDRVLFSAKESVFKAWFPAAGQWLGFRDAVVAFAPEEGTFRARLLVDGPEVGGRELRSFDGRFAVAGELVLTAVVVPNGQERRASVTSADSSARATSTNPA